LAVEGLEIIQAQDHQELIQYFLISLQQEVAEELIVIQVTQVLEDLAVEEL
jgi:hypothetical protein